MEVASLECDSLASHFGVILLKLAELLSTSQDETFLQAIRWQAQVFISTFELDIFPCC